MVPAVIAWVWVLVHAGAAEPLRFNRDIRPILSDHCFHCHGFDANHRKADLRLDTREGATAPRKGRPAVVPGDPEASELWHRITAADPADRMPPPDSGHVLTPEQIERVRRWIAEGAPYEKHWSFEPPQRPPLPEVRRTDWPRNAVDRFILARLEREGLAPSPEADRVTLIRRVTLDLTGLPPTPEEVEAFLKDNRPDAYERLVDRLLDSPRYGEHMAHYWLDAARYGDTHGLHLDNERSMWAYRDWVVSAFNRNLPFDRFTVEQLAGDLLPNPTRDQLIASGFNRCNVTTSEGGAIEEEFRVRYAVDRVETVGTVWMGLTLGCAACHDHKIDPITQKEFYQLFAIFNNLAENAMDGNALLPPPSLSLPTPEQERELAALERRLQELESALTARVAQVAYRDPAEQEDRARPQPVEVSWVDDDFPPGAEPRRNEGNPAHRWVMVEEGPVQKGRRSLERSGQGVHQTFFSSCDQPLVVGTDDVLFAHVFLDPEAPPTAVMLQYHVDGQWSRRANWGDPDAIPYGRPGTPEKLQMGPLPPVGRWVRLEVSTAALGLAPGTRITGMAFTLFGGRAWWDHAGLVTVRDPGRDPEQSLTAWWDRERSRARESGLPESLRRLLDRSWTELTPGERDDVRFHYLRHVYTGDAELVELRTQREKVRAQKADLERQIPGTLISRELEQPRPAHVLIRGQYDKPGEPVGPGVPAILPPLPPAERTNRLTFALWLVSPEHPLTARVTVNRFWQQLFGIGLVRTSEDFGLRGEWPSHPELLDWLAVEFRESGWDVKRLMRLLVTSATYRQSSRVTPELLERDPENRLLARGPRHRLDAEVVRDSVLFVSGLLNLEMGGRGVRPYQPPGIWEAVGYTTSNTARYEQDHGPALYRRSLYTFWKRTAPPPFMVLFDAPSREQCTVRRERTTTPLQALALMNDVQVVEASRHLGARMWREGGTDDRARLRRGFRLVTGRAPEPEEELVLLENLKRQRARYQNDLESARALLAVGESPAPEDIPPGELAAYTLVANLLLNLDEFLTKN
nr:PSD1 and planctomycete cytochrome C domain-containing protein [Limisphaera ngatamarikiensis]